MNGFFKSFYYAFKGIYYAFEKQRNIKVQLIIGISVILWAIIIEISLFRMVLLLFIIFLIIILEMINTAIEKLIDHISTEYNENLGKIKDIMAGAVLLAAILSVILGVLILGPATLNFFNF